jgi:hypothetical protein
MPDSASAVLIVEDRAHEEFLKPLIERLAREAGRSVSVRPYSARGGHPRAREELRTFQRLMETGDLGLHDPTILVVGIDANCSSWSQAHRAITGDIAPRLRDRVVIACPDPHIERWFLADPDSVAQLLGRRPRLGKRKCDRDRYKQILARTVREAGHPALLGGLEFAREIVGTMDLYRAGRNEKSLRHFVNGARRLLAR